MFDVSRSSRRVGRCGRGWEAPRRIPTFSTVYYCNKQLMHFVAAMAPPFLHCSLVFLVVLSLVVHIGGFYLRLGLR